MSYIFIAFLLSCKYCQHMEETIRMLAELTRKDAERVANS